MVSLETTHQPAVMELPISQEMVWVTSGKDDH